MNLRISRLLAVAAFVAASGQSRAADLTTLISFNGSNGGHPLATLTTDTNGNLFGTTSEGGGNDAGTVFEIAKTAGGYASTPTILYSFCAQAGCTDGDTPNAGLVVDANGNLFGTTERGGACPLGDGSVFEIAKTASGYATTPAILFSYGCLIEASPSTGLIADADGNLIGVTIETGSSSVFEIAKTSSGYASTPTILAEVTGAEGLAGRLTIDANGNLFGATCQINLGGYPYGRVVEIAKTASGYTTTILYSFCSLANCADGARPPAGPIADTNGNLFGTTSEGGGNDAGTVFEIAKTASGYARTPTILVSFDGTHGANPGGSPIADANGNLFGTTFEGGAYGLGTVFEIAKTASGYASAPTILVSFDGTHGANPGGSLIADANGNLFGTTGSGGAYGYGTVFKIATFAGTPGTSNCLGLSISALTKKYGGLNATAAALGFSSVAALQNAILAFCGG